MVIRGGHVSKNYPEFIAQRGVVLDENTGGTAFINCDINNFGVGITTSCIQNYLTSCKLTGNYIGVLGTGNDYNAGLSMTNVEFVSNTDPNTSAKHIYIDGAANDWWLTNVWFEGADIALSVGQRDRGGPSQFGIVNCMSRHAPCAWTSSTAVSRISQTSRFDGTPRPKPTELRIDQVGCPEGTAVNLISGYTFDFGPADFSRPLERDRPWTCVRRQFSPDGGHPRRRRRR